MNTGFKCCITFKFGKIAAKHNTEIIEEIMVRKLTKIEILWIRKFMDRFLAYADD